MVFKLMLPAKKRWTGLRRNNRAAEVIRGANFKNRIAHNSEKPGAPPNPPYTTFGYNS